MLIYDYYLLYLGLCLNEFKFSHATEIYFTCKRILYILTASVVILFGVVLGVMVSIPTIIINKKISLYRVHGCVFI